MTPPITNISFPLQTALWPWRVPSGDALIFFHEFASGSYAAPSAALPLSISPPKMIIFEPVHTAVWSVRPDRGEAAMVVHASFRGSYFAPSARCSG
jgi:hypothetical protein